MEKDIRDTIDKYTNIFHILLKCLDSIPIKTKTRKEYSIPAKSLLAYFESEAKDINPTTDKLECCKFIRDRATGYIDIIKTEITEFDRKFIQILDRFAKSHYYANAVDQLKYNTTSNTVNGDVNTVDNHLENIDKDTDFRIVTIDTKSIDIHSNTRTLPYPIQYALRSEDYLYLADYQFTESGIFSFVITLLKHINQFQRANKEWKYIRKTLPYSFTLDDNELETAIHIDDATKNSEFTLFNNGFILNEIVKCVPFLGNAQTTSVLELLQLEQFKMFYHLNGTLREILDMPDYQEQIKLSDRLSSMIPANILQGKPWITVNIREKLSSLGAYMQLSKEQRLLIKTFYPYTKGTAFLKECDFAGIQQCTTLESISQMFGFSFYIVNTQQWIYSCENKSLCFLLFSVEDSNKNVKYHVIKKDHQFIHIKFKNLPVNPTFKTFSEFCETELHNKGDKGDKESRELDTQSSSSSSSYDAYREKYMSGYYVPSTFEPVFFAYLKDKILPYGVKDIGEAFLVFDRYRIPREPLRTQLQKVYNLVWLKPPVPVEYITIRQMIQMRIIVSLLDLYHTWSNAHKTSAISLIERNDGYQTFQGYFCRESDIFKTGVYQQTNKYVLDRIPWVSVDNIQHGAFLPRNVCMLACMTCHWNHESLETFTDTVLNTMVPVDVDIIFDKKFRPKFKKFENLSALQLLPYIMKYGPVSRCDTIAMDTDEDFENIELTPPEIDFDFYMFTFYAHTKWNLGVYQIDDFTADLKKYLECHSETTFYYLIRACDVKFIHVESILPRYTRQFPPLPCNVKLYDNQIGVLYSHNEEDNEYTVRCGKDVRIVSRDEFSFTEESRFLPYPVTFLEPAYSQSDYCPSPGNPVNTQMVPDNVGEGVATEHVSNDSFMVEFEDYNGIVNKRKFIWNVHFIWDDQRYVDQHTHVAVKATRKNVYLNDLNIDKNGNAKELFTLDEPYLVPPLTDRLNNRPFFDLFHPSSRCCLLPFLQFIGAKTLLKVDQFKIMEFVMEQKKCLESSCLLSHAAMVIWMQCRQGTRTYNHNHLISSLLELQSEERINSIDFDDLSHNFQVIQLILSKVYQSIHFHHTLAETWEIALKAVFGEFGSNCNESQGQESFKDTFPTPASSSIPIDLSEVKTFKTVEYTDFRNTSSSEDDVFAKFTEHRYITRLYKCFLEKNSFESNLNLQLCEKILDVFWHSQKWYQLHINTTEACRFRDQIWMYLTSIPDIFKTMPRVQLERLFSKLNVKSIDEIYLHKDPEVLLIVVKFIDSLSLWPKITTTV